MSVVNKHKNRAEHYCSRPLFSEGEPHFRALEDRVDEIAFAPVQRFDDEDDPVPGRHRTEAPEHLDVLFERLGGRESIRDHARARAAENDDLHPDFLCAAKRGGRIAVQARSVYRRAHHLQIRRQEDIRSRHGKAARSQRSGSRREFGVGRLGREKLGHKPFDEITGRPHRQAGDGGGIGAEAELHLF